MLVQEDSTNLKYEQFDHPANCVLVGGKLRAPLTSKISLEYL